MKKVILPTVCFAVLSTPAFAKVTHAAEKDTPVTEVGQNHVETKYVNVDSGSNLNVRANASSSAPVLAKLTYGSKVIVFSEESGWAKVTANGKEGYVSAKYLTTSAPSKSSIASTPAPASAPVAKPTTATKYVQVATGSYLNLRSSASTTGPVLMKLTNGIEVTVDSEVNGWAKVKVRGKEGYVSAKYLTTSAPSKSSIASKSAPAPASVAKPTTATKYVQVATGSYLNLRSSASTTGSVLTKLTNGIEVTVDSEVNGWAKVKVRGKEGYVSTKYLTTSAPSKSSIASTPSTPAPASVAKPTNTTKYVQVATGSYLNLRSSASTTGSVLTKLTNGAEVTVDSESNGWAKVKANGKEGYVSAKYLTTSAPSKSSTSSTPSKSAPASASVAKPTTATKYVQVATGSYLNLRSSASTTGPVLMKLTNGIEVTVDSEANGWAKVTANGKEGYVSAKYLTASAPSKSAPAPASVAKPTTATKYVQVATGSYLNLRSSASTTGSVLMKLTDGIEVTVDSEANGWAKVKANGKEGYVSAKYLTASAPSKSSAPSTPNQVPVPIKQEATIKYVDVKLKSSLNMRNKPSTNASIIIKLAKGIEVKVISENNGWSLVKVYGKEGYVSSEYLSTLNPGSSLGTDDEETKDSSNNVSLIPTPGVNEEDTPTIPTPVAEMDDTDSDNEQQVSETPKLETTIKYVNIKPASNLNMRSEPSANGAIITKLASGTAVTFYSEENGWAKVNVNGKTGYVSAEYLIAKGDPLDTSNQKVNLKYTEYETTLDELTQIQMKANPQTDTKYLTYIREDALYIQDQANPTVGVVQGSGWNVRGGVGTNYWTVGKVNDGETLKLKSKIKGEDGYDWYEVDYNRSWVNASPADVKVNLDPNNSLNNPLTSLQFLKLSETTSLDQFEVNERILSGKGVLEGHAATFITAGEKYGVNDVYLISHALLETGNGKSQLAQGVELYGKTVYNMFGIGAYDGTALSSGAKFAYNAGWFSPEAAIMGGAKFISQGYISSGQDTLYKMRWNPQATATNQVATHQYATDIGWASKQVKQIYNIYSLLNSYKVTLDIPLYKK